MSGSTQGWDPDLPDDARENTVDLPSLRDLPPLPPSGPHDGSIRWDNGPDDHGYGVPPPPDPGYREPGPWPPRGRTQAGPPLPRPVYPGPVIAGHVITGDEPDEVPAAHFPTPGSAPRGQVPPTSLAPRGEAPPGWGQPDRPHRDGPPPGPPPPTRPQPSRPQPGRPLAGRLPPAGHLLAPPPRPDRDGPPRRPAEAPEPLPSARIQSPGGPGRLPEPAATAPGGPDLPSPAHDYAHDGRDSSPSRPDFAAPDRGRPGLDRDYGRDRSGPVRDRPGLEPDRPLAARDSSAGGREFSAPGLGRPGLDRDYSRSGQDLSSPDRDPSPRNSPPDGYGFPGPARDPRGADPRSARDPHLPPSGGHDRPGSGPELAGPDLPSPASGRGRPGRDLRSAIRDYPLAGRESSAGGRNVPPSDRDRPGRDLSAVVRDHPLTGRDASPDGPDLAAPGRDAPRRDLSSTVRDRPSADPDLAPGDPASATGPYRDLSVPPRDRPAAGRDLTRVPRDLTGRETPGSVSDLPGGDLPGRDLPGSDRWGAPRRLPSVARGLEPPARDRDRDLPPVVRDLVASLPPLPPAPAAESPATVPPQEAPDPTLAALAERIRELQALAASPSAPVRSPSASAPPAPVAPAPAPSASAPPAPTPTAPTPAAPSPTAPSPTAPSPPAPAPPAPVPTPRTSSAPFPPVPASPSPRPAEASAPAPADLDEHADLPRPADPPAAELVTRPRTEISQLRANYEIARQDDSVSDSRAAAAEPTSVSSYAPRDEPAPDRLPAVRGSAGDVVAGQGYPPSRDYRPMEYPTTDYRATDYRATDYRATDYRAVDYRRGPADYRGLPPDRPARGSVADFRLRLERLPAGHPSSPWDDQGMPRPTPQQLRQLELPLADEERDAEPPARASLLAASADLSGPTIKPGYADEEAGGSELPPTPEPPAIEPPPIGLPPSRPRPSGPVSSEPLSSQPLPSQPLSSEPLPSQPPAARNGAAEPGARPASPWLTGRNGTTRDPDDSQRGDHGAAEYVNGAAADHSGSGAGVSRNGLPPDAATRRDRGDPYDTATSRDADEPPARNGRNASPSSVFDADWRHLDPAPGRNGHAESEPGRATDQASGAASRAAGERPATGERATANGVPSANGPPAGRRLTPEQQKIAGEALEKYRAADGRNMFGGYGESGLTPAMRRVEAYLPHGRLAPDSEENSLKSPERYQEKLARMIERNPGIPAGELADEIYDAARYTFLFEPQDYTDGTWLVHRRLKAQGFELEARRNLWENHEVKGINTRWRDPAHDLAFEVQFHTPSSWEVLQRTHEAYLRITDPRTPPAERVQLRARQAAEAAASRAPVRCAEIGDFRADTR
jgi:hypothetical protein